jgi:hypothetical protein
VVDVETDRAALRAAVETNVGRDLSGASAQSALELDIERVGLEGSSGASRRPLLEVAIREGVVYALADRPVPPRTSAPPGP